MLPKYPRCGLSAAITMLASALLLPGSCYTLFGSTVWKAIITAHDENIKDYAKRLQDSLKLPLLTEQEHGGPPLVPRAWEQHSSSMFSNSSISFWFSSSVTRSLMAGSSCPFYSLLLQPWTLMPSLKPERNKQHENFPVLHFLTCHQNPRLLLPSWVIKQLPHAMPIGVSQITCRGWGR